MFIHLVFRVEETDTLANLNENSNGHCTECTECTKNLNKMKLLHQNNENLRIKYNNLLKEMSALRKSYNQIDSTNDEQITMMAECQMDDSNESVSACEVCWKLLPPDGMSTHICMDHLRIIRCEYCSAPLKSTMELCDHLSEVHHSNAKVYKCDMCSLEYSSCLLLKFHQISELDYSKSTDVDASDTIVKCFICDADFMSKTDLQSHLRNHFLEGKCEICNDDVAYHEIGAHLCDDLISIQCEYCHKSFDAIIKLIAHVKSKHTDTILHKCRMCPKYYAIAVLRDLHEKYHPAKGLYPWKCDQCSKSFARQWTLITHQKIHLNESMTKEKC